MLLLPWSAGAHAAHSQPYVLAAPADQVLRTGASETTSPLTVAADELVLLDIAINGQEQHNPRIFLRHGGVLHLRPRDLENLRIRSPDVPPIMYAGQGYVPLSAWPQIAVELDQNRQLVRLSVPAELFKPSTVSAGSVAEIAASPFRAPLAAFVNYDATAQLTSTNNAVTIFLESGVSSRWGLLVNGGVVGDAAGPSRTARLDSYYIYDDPRRVTRLVVGDAITRGAEWSQPIRFGGVRYGTEFSLLPGMITFPTPVFTGQTALPSNIQLYVNEALRFNGAVDQGVFTLNQLPVITGAGQVSLVVRDALGVERQVTSSYYVSPSLLRRGLSEFSFEAGAERLGYGLENFDYRYPFAAGSYRYGLSDWLTVEAGVQGSELIRNGGISLAWAKWPLGEFGLAVAASEGELGAGGLMRIHYSRLSPRWNISLSYLVATRAFAQLGVHSPLEQTRDQVQAIGGLAMGGFGNLSASYTDLRLGGGTRSRVGSLNYSVPLLGQTYLNVFALASGQSPGGRAITVGAGFSIPIGPRSSAYVQADSHNVTASYQVSPPTDIGLGYRLMASSGDLDQHQAEITWRGRAGEVTAQAAQLNGDSGARMLLSGGAIFAAGEAYLTRRVNGSFALVDVPEQEGVRIYLDNRAVTRTGPSGRAVVPELRPYEQNRISLSSDDLPLEASIETDTLRVIPRFRGGVQARFNVRQDRPGTLVLRLPNGQLLEAGAMVSVDRGAERLYTGYDGELFVTALHAGMTLKVFGAEGECRAVLDTVPAGNVLPRIELVCSTVGTSP